MAKQSKYLHYILIAPTAVIMLALVYYPIAVTLCYSFMRMELSKPKLIGFIGLWNYLTLISDPLIWNAFFNSMIVLAEVIVITVFLGLAFAFLLNRNTRIKGVLTAIAIVPWALPPVVNGVIWRWLFHPNFGFVNKILLLANIIAEPVQWLTEHYLIISIVSLVVAWRSIPLAAITFLSSLQSIPRQLYEAADIDGCGLLSRFFHITLPLLRPSMGIVLTTTSISAINVFDEIVSLSGYSGAVRTLMIETYLRTFKFLNFGKGSALIYLVMVATAIFGVIYARRIYNEVEYL